MIYRRSEAIKISILSIMLAIMLFAFLAVNPGCAWNNEEDLYGEFECDTTNLYWEGEIGDILARNCLSCHNETLNYNDIKYTSYNKTMIPLNDGRFRGVTNRLPGFAQMPKDQPKLDACTLLKLNTWLDNGAPEN